MPFSPLHKARFAKNITLMLLLLAMMAAIFVITIVRMGEQVAPEQPKKSNLSLALSLLAIVVGMGGMAYGSVPLYRLFCQVTGYGGTTQPAVILPDRVLDRKVTVRFNADVAKDLPWKFAPQQTSVDVHVGEQMLAFYDVKSHADKLTYGMATYNVTPHKAGVYFNKIHCFCYDRQPMEAGAEADMPVSFFIDPAFADDPAMKDVKTITLSYTFFKLDDK